nr:DUF4179 domain-containing protein [Lachnospiraceae bacterium]
VWNRICERQLQETNGFSRRPFLGGNKISGKLSIWKTWAPVVAALLICVILIPGIVYADEIVNYFRGHLSQSPELASNVNQSVFQDGDNHVSMEVSELLSDGYATCMTVKYTAHDQEGREWLFGETFQDVPPMYRELMHNFNLENVLHIVPIEEDSENKIWTSADFGTQEIEKEQTKTSRTFSLEYNMSNISSKRYLLTYPLFGKSKKKALTVKNLLETYTYALDGEYSNANYTPKYLRISKIKFMVYGENHGVYQRTGSDTKLISEEEIDSATLYFKNRSPLDLIENAVNYFYMGDIVPEDFNCNMDLLVLSGGFYDPAEWIPYEGAENWYDEDNYGKNSFEKRIDHRLAIDPEDVQKIEINGGLFTLNRVD